MEYQGKTVLISGAASGMGFLCGKMYAEVEWKHRTTVSFPPSHATRKDLESVMLNNAGLYSCRDVQVAPDGSLYIAHYFIIL